MIYVAQKEITYLASEQEGSSEIRRLMAIGHASVSEFISNVN